MFSVQPAAAWCREKLQLLYPLRGVPGFIHTEGSIYSGILDKTHTLCSSTTTPTTTSTSTSTTTTTTKTTGNYARSLQHTTQRRIDAATNGRGGGGAAIKPSHRESDGGPKPFKEDISTQQDIYIYVYISEAPASTDIEARGTRRGVIKNKKERTLKRLFSFWS